MSFKVSNFLIWLNVIGNSMPDIQNRCIMRILDVHFLEPDVEWQQQTTRSIVLSLITALFSIISRESLIWHPARRKLCLFAFIIKFSIRDNAHPLSCSWNFSSDDKVGSTRTTHDTYHSRKSVHWYSSKFRRYSYSRVYHPSWTRHWKQYLFLQSHIALHYAYARAYAISLASSKNRRGSICLEFITASIKVRLLNAVSILR